MRLLWRLIGALAARLHAAYWGLIYRGQRARYDIAPSFRFNGAGIWLYGAGRIELGDESYLGEHSSLQAAPGCAVRVGRRCRMASNVHVYTQTAAADADFRVGEGPPVLGDVHIGDGAWIGANVYIGPGIAIGANAVVGANSVVTRSIPAGEIWAGVPARRLRAKRNDAGR